MMTHVTLLFDGQQNLYHASKTYAGLIELAARGEIAFSIRPLEPGLSDGITVMVRLEDASLHEPRLIALDLRDASDVVTRTALERCDTYFKRSYHAPDLQGLPEHLREKILPLGLNYGCTTPASKRRLTRSLAGCHLSRAALAPLSFARRLPELWNVVRTFYSLPDIQEFEQGPEADLEPKILFQTRVWEPEESADNLDELNEQRADLVRRLRAKFGDRFVGGLVPTAFARRHYPDLLTETPTKRKLYTALSKRNLIGIYSRGVFHSVAFKLPEYLAAAQCIVSEPIRNALPSPLVPGRHYLEFRTSQECLDLCDYLLCSREAAALMRSHNHDYYWQEVNPVSHLRKCLSAAAQGPDFVRGVRSAGGRTSQLVV